MPDKNAPAPKDIHTELLAYFDKDGDGKLNPEEWLDLFAMICVDNYAFGMSRSHDSKDFTELYIRFGDFKREKKGKDFNEAECLATLVEQASELFKACDKNGDGLCSLEELLALSKKLK